MQLDPQTQISSEILQREETRRQGQNTATVAGRNSNNPIRMRQPQSEPPIPSLTHARTLPFNRSSLNLSTITIIVLIIAIIVLSAALFLVSVRSPQISTPNTNSSHNSTQSPGPSSPPTQTSLPVSTNSPTLPYQADWSNGTLNSWEPSDSEWHTEKTGSDQTHPEKTYLINYSTPGFKTNDDSDITAPLQFIPANYDIVTEITIATETTSAKNHPSYDHFYAYSDYFGIFVGSSSPQSADGYTCRFQGNNNGNDSLSTFLVQPKSTPIITGTVPSKLTTVSITLKVRGNKIEASVIGQVGQICTGEMNNPGRYIGITTHMAAIEVDSFKIIEKNI